MQVAVGSRVRKEHWLLGVKPTLAAGRDWLALHLICLKGLVSRGRKNSGQPPAGYSSLGESRNQDRGSCC